VCSFVEKLILPPRTGTRLNLTSCADSADPFVEPWARLIAVTTPSIASAPPRKPPVPGAAPAALSDAIIARTAVDGSSPKTDAKVTK